MPRSPADPPGVREVSSSLLDHCSIVSRIHGRSYYPANHFCHNAPFCINYVLTILTGMPLCPPMFQEEQRHSFFTSDSFRSVVLLVVIGSPLLRSRSKGTHGEQLLLVSIFTLACTWYSVTVSIWGQKCQ